MLNGATAPQRDAGKSPDGSEFSDGVGTDVDATDSWSGTTDDESVVSTGSTIEAAVENGYDVTVAYVPSEGGDTAPLASDSGADA